MKTLRRIAADVNNNNLFPQQTQILRKDFYNLR